MQNPKSKIHIDIQHLLKLATSTEYKKVMFSTNAENLCECCILKKNNENLVNILGGHELGSPAPQLCLR